MSAYEDGMEEYYDKLAEEARNNKFLQKKNKEKSED